MPDRPDIVIVMTDEERAVPPYESAEVLAWRHHTMVGRRWFDEHGVSFARHYTGSLACVPSRPTIFTGQYPDLHGVTQTDGIGKRFDDSRLRWLRAGEVPTYDDADPGTSPLAAQRSWIDECYAGYDAVAILQRLRAASQEDARAAAELLEARSPLAVCATLEAYRRAAQLDSVDAVLEQDRVLAANLALTPDFGEGVRAQIVDKDRSPDWSHASVADVTDAEVAALFEPR